jgi:hypothetical protein
MGWPRNSDFKLYQEQADKSYLLVVVCNGQNGSGSYDAVGNAFEGSRPSLCSATAHPKFLLDRCKRVAWDDMPLNWQNAFLRYMNHPLCDPFIPTNYPGLHRTPARKAA